MRVLAKLRGILLTAIKKRKEKAIRLGAQMKQGKEAWSGLEGIKVVCNTTRAHSGVQCHRIYISIVLGDK
jgi:hypothetical protein